MPLADPVSDPVALAFLEVLPPEARRTARAAGLEPLIAELLAKNDEPPTPEQLLRYHELALRVTAFDAQVSSLVFELACARERVRDLIAAAVAEEGARQFALAVSSLIVGAGSSTAAGVWALSNAHSDLPAWTAVGGGVVTAGIGAAALLVPERPVRLEHARNLLKPILDGADPQHLYASFVFRMLAARYAGDGAAPRDRMLSEFASILRSRVKPKHRETASAILAGSGTLYTRNLLEAREGMLHVVEMAVAGVARDLELLDRTLVRLFATRTAPAPRASSSMR